MKLLNEVVLTDAMGESFTFDTLHSLKSFLKNEYNFWEKKSTALTDIGLTPPRYMQPMGYIQPILEAAEKIIKEAKALDQSTLDAHVQSSIVSLSTNLSRWIWSGHTFITPWQQAYTYSQQTGDAFLEWVVSRTASNVTSPESLRGYLMAYEFSMQDDSKILKRRSAEKASFSTLKDYLVAEKNALINETTSYQEGLRNWQEKHVEGVNQTVLNHSTEFQGRLAAWTESVTKLEKLYEEKLRLDKPAAYWARNARKLRKQGFYWVFALVLTAATAIAFFSYFFISWLLGVKTEVKFHTLEGIILFSVIISCFAILIRAFSKLAFSSFHLQRDAEEREQLAHVYLALNEGAEIDIEARKIVLQALFSRAETGLLANESGPTMPGMHDLVSNLSRTR